MSDRARDRKRKPQTAGREIEPAPSRAFPLSRFEKYLFWMLFYSTRILFCNKPYTDWTWQIILSRPRHFCNFPPTNETQKSKNTWARKSTKKTSSSRLLQRRRCTQNSSLFFSPSFSLSLLLSKRAEFCVGHEDPPRSWSCSSREGWANASGRG